MAINTQKLLPGSSGGTLARLNKSAGSFSVKKYSPSTKIKAEKSSASAEKTVKKDKESFSGDTIISDFKAINKSVKNIDRSLKSMLSTNNKILAEKNKQVKLKKRKAKEDNLEKQTKKEQRGGKKNGISIRTPSFLDKILNFFFWTIAGNLLFKFLTPENIDKAKGFVNGIISVGKFIGGIFVKTVEGLVNFIDFSYEKFDQLRGFIEKVGGEGAVKLFDKFSGMLNKVLNGAIILAILLSKSKGLGGGRGGGRGSGRGGGRPQGLNRNRRRGSRRGGVRIETRGGLNTRSRRGVIQSRTGDALFGARADKGGGVSGKDIARAQKDVVRKYTQRFGREAAEKRFGKAAIQELGGKYARSGATNLARKGAVAVLGKSGTKAGLKVLKNTIAPIVKRIPIIGGLIDFALNYFVFKEPIGKAAFAAIGSTIFGALGATAGSIVPVVGNIVGGALGGLAGDMAGKWLYDTFFDKKNPVDTSEIEAKRNGGTVGQGRTLKTSGETQEGKAFNLINPPTTKEGKDIGGEKVIQKLFKDKNKNTGPLSALKQLSQKFKKIPVIGRIMGAAVDIALGQLPPTGFFKDLAKTFLSFHFKLKASKTIERMSTLMSRLIPRLEEGGEVDSSVTVGRTLRRDIADNPFTMLKTVETSLETAIRQDITNSINVIRKQLGLEVLGEEDPSSGPSSTPSSTPPAGGGQTGTATGAVSASELYKEIGANAKQWDIFRNTVALIESGGKYNIFGGSGNHYDGRYQMGEAAKIDGSKIAGVSFPGHSDDPNAQVRAAYRANPELQEKIFTAFTIANHRYLMRNKTYAESTVERKLQILGYAHNQGMGGAEKWITTGVVGADGFGTKGTKYTDMIAANFRAQKSGGELQVAQGAVDVPSAAPQQPTTPAAGSGQSNYTQLANNPDAKKGSKLAGELGRYLDSQGVGSWGSGVHQHPEHPPWPRESGHSPGSLHYASKGARAIDIGGYGRSRGYDDQEQILAAIHRWNKMKGVKPVQLLSDGYPGHDNHVHVAYAGGGEIQPPTKDPNKYNSLQSYQNYGGGQSTLAVQKIYIKT